MSCHEQSSTSPTLLRLLRGPITNETAWQKFLERYRPLIRAWCRQARLQPNDMEEIEGRVLARLVPALRELEYDPARSFRGYLRTVVEHDLCDLWRERAQKPGAYGSGSDAVHEQLKHLPSAHPFAGLADAIDRGFQDDLRRVDQILARVQQQVTPTVWQAFWLTVVEGHAVDEVAQRLNMTTAYVYVARGRVAKKLHDEAKRRDDCADS